MSRLTPARQALEETWSKRLADAKRGLASAHADTVKIQREFPAGEIPSADGNFPLDQAIRLEISALRKYHRVLRTYADPVRHGTIPGSSSSPKRR